MGSGAGGGPDKQGRKAQDFRLEEQRRAQAAGATVSREQQRFRRNIEAAQEIEARKGAPGILGAIGGVSRSMQSNILRSQSVTADPVRNEQGRTVGVVGRGLFGGRAYTGQSAYDPISRAATGDDRGDGIPEPKPVTQTQPAPTQTSTSPAARRRIIRATAGGGGATRRTFY